MEIKYLGTAAAEGSPAAFCNCDKCKSFRLAGGKNLRARTQAVLDDKILIDLNSDTYMNFMRFGLNLSNIKHILITHSHSDHLAPEILMEMNATKNPIESDIYLYGSKVSIETCKNIMNASLDNHDYTKNYQRLHFVQINLFEPFVIDGYTITPLKAKHQPPEFEPFFFLIEKDGKSMIYGNDTGNWYQENITYLKERNVKLDFIGFDCTYGVVPANTYGGHMSLYDSAQQLGILKENGIATDKTKSIVTHFAHWHMILHDDFQKLADEFGINVAYDGVEYEF